MASMIICWAVISSVIMTSQATCQQDVNCHLPDCFCSTFEHPMNRSEIPQMVYFGFDDAVQEEVAAHYDLLFLTNYTNPNGCPISITLFVSHAHTEYSILEKYYTRGFELAVHSVTHSGINTGDRVKQEAADQKHNLVSYVGVPSDEVVGWRSPYLVTAGDPQIYALQDLDFTYDISLIYRRNRMDDDDAWPFTLDYGWPFVCDDICPMQSHKGFWQIPINALRDYKDKYSCAFVDNCYWSSEPNNEEQAYKYIMDNFYSHYNGNRSPFGLHMHAVWFNTLYKRDAMERAIHDMLQYDDVYIVNVKQMLEWMRYPTKLARIKTFDGFGCWPRSKTAGEILLIIFLVLFIIAVVAGIAIFVHWKKLKSVKYRHYINLKYIASTDELVDIKYELFSGYVDNEDTLPMLSTPQG